MRTASRAAIGLLVGFLVGIVVSDLLVVQFHNIDAAKGLPLYLAALCAIAAPIADRRHKK